MASVMTMNSGDFSEFQGFRYPRTFHAPFPINLLSLKGEAREREALGLPEQKPRALTYLEKSVKRRRSTPAPSTPPPSPDTTPPPTPTPNTPPPAPSKPTKTPTKICSVCRLPHEKSRFSKKQWSAGKGRKCSDCVQPQTVPVVTEAPPQPEKVEPVKPNPPTETRWDTMKANNAAKFEEEAGLLRLAAERQARKPVRIPPRPPAPEPVQDTPIVPRIRHKICPTAKKGYRCKIGDSCEGAHSLQEYAPPSCSWGAKCRHVKESPGGLINVSERPCTFIHPGETQDHYHKRSGRHAPRFWTR